MGHAACRPTPGALPPAQQELTPPALTWAVEAAGCRYSLGLTAAVAAMLSLDLQGGSRKTGVRGAVRAETIDVWGSPSSPKMRNLARLQLELQKGSEIQTGVFPSWKNIVSIIWVCCWC